MVSMPWSSTFSGSSGSGLLCASVLVGLAHTYPVISSTVLSGFFASARPAPALVAARYLEALA
ncbi:hypothetical protein [Streptomyces sp. Tu 4128]|uniref:hypothetical protein n=1 Tax=Streptomyces sp. Tu 4128 TaxID=1120314 RepID=UPI0013CEF152|nr:hypothetical protein [Streptomyces sp. Tu 4128]